MCFLNSLCSVYIYCIRYNCLGVMTDYLFNKIIRRFVPWIEYIKGNDIALFISGVKGIIHLISRSISR